MSDYELSGFKAENDIGDQDPYYLMKYGTASDEVAKTTSTTDSVLAVSQAGMDSGQYLPLQYAGVTKLRADGSISQGDELAPSGSTDGEVISTSSANTGDTIVGEALEDASDGDVFRAIVYVDKTETVA